MLGFQGTSSKTKIQRFCVQGYWRTILVREVEKQDLQRNSAMMQQQGRLYLSPHRALVLHGTLGGFPNEAMTLYPSQEKSHCIWLLSPEKKYDLAYRRVIHIKGLVL